MGISKRILIGLAVITALLMAGVALAAPAVETVLDLDPPQLPEGLAIDKQGDIYVGMALTGEVVRVAPDGSQTTVATFNPGGGFLVGLAVDPPGNVYAALASFDPATHGVWRISRTGEVGRIAALPVSGVPNALAFGKHGDLFVSDSFLGRIWRIDTDGTLEAWVDDPLLTATPTPLIPLPIGANGLRFDRHGDLLVANTTRGLIVRIPVNPDGSAGNTELVVQDAALVGADDIVLDARGGLYVAVNAQNSIVRVEPDGSLTALATAADGLDYPASLAFGTGGAIDRGSLYFTNLAFLSGGVNPGVFRLDVGVPGRPLP